MRIANIWEHSITEHPKKSYNEIQTENVALKVIAEQNAKEIEEIEGLKKVIKGAFEKLAIAIDDCISNSACIT